MKFILLYVLKMVVYINIAWRGVLREGNGAVNESAEKPHSTDPVFLILPILPNPAGENQV